MLGGMGRPAALRRAEMIVKPMLVRPSAMASPLPAASTERDLRLDLFRGVALWLIFLDHIPENVANWFTIQIGRAHV